MNRRNTKTPRHIWTEEEMRDAIERMNQRPSSVTVGEWGKQQGFSSESAYRSMKARYEQRHGKVPIPVVALAKQEAPAPIDFRRASKDVQRQMLIEYKNLPDEKKAQWREVHNASQALVSYHNRKKPVQRQGAHPAKKRDDSELAALVSEYMALSANGAKGAWLKARGLNHQSIHDWKKRIAYNNGHAPATNAVAVRVKKASYSRTPDPIPTPIQPTIPLQDGINYLQIKRDLYGEIIEDLRRVLRGER